MAKEVSTPKEVEAQQMQGAIFSLVDALHGQNFAVVAGKLRPSNSKIEGISIRRGGYRAGEAILHEWKNPPTGNAISRLVVTAGEMGDLRKIIYEIVDGNGNATGTSTKVDIDQLYSEMQLPKWRLWIKRQVLVEGMEYDNAELLASSIADDNAMHPASVPEYAQQRLTVKKLTEIANVLTQQPQ